MHAKLLIEAVKFIKFTIKIYNFVFNRLSKEIVKKIDIIAHKNNLSLNQIVIQCLNYAVNNLDNKTESKMNTRFQT